MDKRDPRKDPQPGDVTLFNDSGLTCVYRVTRIKGRMVYYLQSCNGKTEEQDTYLEDWIMGSETDEVLHVAE